ncbi:polyphosphate kinase 2 family protein [Anaerolinea thermolimosa]|uniref:polyphosphate kinase 2 family protein n=1 Tax=Anaerolinea thermolimosa TaxID=229919 RepID=UPI000782C23C|nr:polyphosphate kinase 2 family protein [Anaerolinea thermolimosa]
MHTYRIDLDKKVNLDDFDPAETRYAPGGKENAEQSLLQLNRQLEALQESLYAEHKHRVLVVLQGMDTSGKDGVIRRVFEGVNPQGVRVASFKVPTPVELDHDYLWRVHQQTPARGEIVIFNRSHYEDVLVVRVHSLVPEAVWKKRYEQINAFERLLTDEGTTILKFFLHIDPQEQKERLLERLEKPEKNWKFNAGDLKERALWKEYMKAYEDVLEKTSTPWAPWYVVPANKKWYRDLVISTLLVETLQNLEIRLPAPFSAQEIAEFRRQLSQEDRSG